MNANRNRRSALDELVAKKCLTADGKDWLISALDPFHDYNHQIAGYPDADCSQTVVSCFNFAAEITAPAALADGATWDAHVYSMPLAKSSTYTMCSEDGLWYAATDTANTAPLGLLNVCTAYSGTPLIPTTAPIAGKQYRTLPDIGVTDLVSGNSRVIGAGFEITNTTSDLYKQGTLTAYRMPQNPATHSQAVASIVYSRGYMATGVRLQQVPSGVSDANKMAGSRTWEAKEGAYATIYQSTVHNPLMASSNKFVFVGEPQQTSSSDSTDMMISSSDHMAPFGDVCFPPDLQKTIPYDTTGVFLTGLSAQTTISVKLKVYVERAPSFQDAILCPLASPSAGYDINALQLYAQLVNCLPCAVRVSENGLGDWWRGILKVVRDVAEPLGRTLGTFLPGAGLVGSAATKVAGTLYTASGGSDRKQSGAEKKPKQITGPVKLRKMKPKFIK